MSEQDDISAGDDPDQQASEKLELDQGAKQAAAEMMQAYEDRPTVVLPGSGGTVTGTAVNDWLTEDGDPIYNDDAGDIDTGEGTDEQAKREQIEKDKARNDELREAAAAENKGEKD
ncbi:hypothetical protein [Mycobacterium servetii]|uniref:Uncharacterized protein n=1 Tax=Mycobacterium servetii TaxID=3237418 RepID=A0ABV4C0F5_9MYCO